MKFRKLTHHAPDLTRFARAVDDDLSLGALAERFGISTSKASRLRGDLERERRATKEAEQ